MLNLENNNNNHPSVFANAGRIRQLELRQHRAEARRLQSQELVRLARLAVARGLEFLRSYVLVPAARWYLRRKLYNTLSGLDDRMLEDIGLSRHEIAMVVLEVYPGKTAVDPAPKAAVHFLNAGKKRAKAAAQAEDTPHPLAA